MDLRSRRQNRHRHRVQPRAWVSRPRPRWCAEGCRVTICARGEARLAEAAAELRAAAGAAIACLLSRPTLPPSRAWPVVARTVETFGGLDILVNNVGLARGRTHRRHDRRRVAARRSTRRSFPAIRASRLAVPHMRRRGGGAIVMIASIWGREAGGRMTYNAVKAAEISLAKSMAQQLARDNIRVNSVAPGSILFPGGLAPPPAGGSGRDRRLRQAGTAVRTLRPPRRGRGGRSRSWSRRAPAGSAGQVCPLTAASHAP